MEDFYNIEDQNSNLDTIDAVLAAGDIDCGMFADTDPVMLHDSSPSAHHLLAVDGNGGEISTFGGIVVSSKLTNYHMPLLLARPINATACCCVWAPPGLACAR